MSISSRMNQDFTNGVAFMMGLTVTVRSLDNVPERIVVQPEVEAWLQEMKITDWELRWVDVTDPKDIASENPDRHRYLLETALVFKNPKDAVMFKLALAGKIKIPDQYKSPFHMILNLSP